ncbi:MAG TPA: serine acetyltransferase [Methylotenera sp.]|nr:serine acetyltransferase [Methylotenera sp.]
MSKSNNNSNEISSEIPDWSREYKRKFEWSPSRSLLASIRSYQRLSVSSNIFNKTILKNWAVLRHRLWSIITGADIPVNCRIEGGLLIPHPNGIVIHPEVKIGPNCLIFQQVTLGTLLGPEVPELGGHVDIGAGAKVLGGIKICNHACIGANAVVMQDVPAGKTAVGIPARILD